MNAMREVSNYTKSLIIACVVVWLLSAIGPYDWETWLLEQIAAVMGIILLIWAAGHLRFSKPAQAGFAVLFVAHAIGTHYTYSLTPYDTFFEQLIGWSVNELCGFERNHYDRFVHLLFGLVTAVPLRDFFMAYLRCSSPQGWALGASFNISISTVYELMEWMAALVFSDDTGTSYLGSQGDIWDAQVDVALGIVGFALAYGVCAAQAVAARILLRRSPIKPRA